MACRQARPVLADLTGDGTSRHRRLRPGRCLDGARPWATARSPRLASCCRRSATTPAGGARWSTRASPPTSPATGAPTWSGIGAEFVWTALGNGDGTFAAPQRVPTQFSFRKGWRVGARRAPARRSHRRRQGRPHRLRRGRRADVARRRHRFVPPGRARARRPAAPQGDGEAGHRPGVPPVQVRPVLQRPHPPAVPAAPGQPGTHSSGDRPPPSPSTRTRATVPQYDFDNPTFTRRPGRSQLRCHLRATTSSTSAT